MPRFGVVDRDDAVRRRAPGDPPGALAVSQLDVLVRHQRQQSHRVGLLRGEILVSHGLEDRMGVPDQRSDHPLDVGRVVPRTHRLAHCALVVVGGQLQGTRLGHQPANNSDLRHHLGDRVLAGHGVVEHGRVQGPPLAGSQHSGGTDHLAHRLEDALGTIRPPQPVAPERQHRRVEAGVVQSQPGRHLPGDAGPQLLDGISIGEPFQGLQHHNRGHHVGRHRRPTRARREEVSEQLVGKQFAAVVGQEPRHRVRGDQMAAERGRVKEVSVGIAGTLHPSIDSHRPSVWDRLTQQSPSTTPPVILTDCPVTG